MEVVDEILTSNTVTLLEEHVPTFLRMLDTEKRHFSRPPPFWIDWMVLGLETGPLAMIGLCNTTLLKTTRFNICYQVKL